MSKVIPGMFPVFGVPIGMFIGSEFGHITLGSFAGAFIGFVVGLGVLVWMLRKPMPEEPHRQTPPRVALLAGLMGFIISVSLLNIYNIAAHPGASKFWLAIAATLSILIAVGISLVIWSRYAQRH